MFSNRLICFAVVFALVATSNLNGSSSSVILDGDSLAPDGQPGFGAPSELRDILKMFRKSGAKPQPLLVHLRSLEPDLDALMQSIEADYLERGYFDLLPAAEGRSLRALHDRYGAYAADPLSVGTQPERVAQSFARMYFDKRFRLRRWLILALEPELTELRDGLALFEAAARSLVIFNESQTRNLVKRLDLSAAQLRAARADLQILHEPRGSSSPPEGAFPQDAFPQDVMAQRARFLDLLNLGDRHQREAGLDELRAEADAAEAKMRSVLFMERLREQIEPILLWRKLANQDARELLELARDASPEQTEKAQASREVAKLSKSKRRKLARKYALEGLDLNPLDAELAWIAGSMSRYVYGEVESGAYYDRFLVLHRIIFLDAASFSGRELSEREQKALRFVMSLYASGKGGGGGN